MMDISKGRVRCFLSKNVETRSLLVIFLSRYGTGQYLDRTHLLEGGRGSVSSCQAFFLIVSVFATATLQIDKCLTLCVFFLEPDLRSPLRCTKH